MKTAEILRQRGIFSVEFITTRNSVEVLEKYAGYLHDNGFVVTFGYVDSRGKADIDKRDEYVKHGDRVIKSIIL